MKKKVKSVHYGEVILCDECKVPFEIDRSFSVNRGLMDHSLYGEFDLHSDCVQKIINKHFSV